MIDRLLIPGFSKFSNFECPLSIFPSFPSVNSLYFVYDGDDSIGWVKVTNVLSDIGLAILQVLTWGYDGEDDVIPLE